MRIDAVAVAELLPDDIKEQIDGRYAVLSFAKAFTIDGIDGGPGVAM